MPAVDVRPALPPRLDGARRCVVFLIATIVAPFLFTVVIRHLCNHRVISGRYMLLLAITFIALHPVTACLQAPRQTTAIAAKQSTSTSTGSTHESQNKCIAAGRADG
jgi:type IV secretory pathway TrbL component